MANYDGLVGIYFYLTPQTTGNGEIRLHLRSGPQAAEDLAISSNTISFDTVKVPGFYGFFIPAQASSNQKYYFAYLEVAGSGDILVGKAAGDTYLNGALYRNGAPEDAQAAFQLSYSRRKAILGLGREAINWVGILAISFFLFVIPGWGLFALLWRGWGGLTWPVKLGLSAGLSLALYPLLLLWTDIIHLHLGALYAWLPPLAGLGMILWRNRKRFRVRTFPRAGELKLPWADAAFIGIVVLIIITRFWAIRSMDAPMWGDSYQHTMIAQLLVDHGGLFTSWQPYAELQTLTYHFGFHTAVAVFHWLSRQGLPQSTLWTGQILNVLAILTLYPLAARLGGNRWAGVGAVLVAGLLSPMPMYYVNWGRYTQLAGQVILPGAIYLAWTTLEAASHTIKSEVVAGPNVLKLLSRIPFDAGQMALTWLILGGLALTHYRILIFAVIFFPTFLILRVRRDTWRLLLSRTIWIGIGAGLLFLPWFINTFAGQITHTFAVQLSTPAEAVSSWTQQYNAIGDLFFYLPALLWLLLPVSIIWGAWRHEQGVVLVGSWWFLILLAANPQWLRLPGEGALSSGAVLMATYIPVGVLAGYLLGQATNYKRQVITLKHKSLGLALMAFVIILGVWGAHERLGDLRVMSNALVTRPDIIATEWIQENTPQDARFMVNSFFAYGDSAIVGSDAGWWLPLLTRRQTTLPPLTYVAERGPRPDYVSWINTLTAEIQKKGITNPDVLALLRARDIIYVYIGQRQGRVNYNGPQTLAPEQLLASPNFHLVYHQDRVWVFELVH